MTQLPHNTSASTARQWQQDSRIVELVHDKLIWDMAMRLAAIPVVAITTDGHGEVVEDGTLPTPTVDFERMAGFEYVRRGGHITVEIDAFTVARATLALRCCPIEELLKLLTEMKEIEDTDLIGNE